MVQIGKDHVRVFTGYAKPGTKVPELIVIDKARSLPVTLMKELL